MSGTLEIGDDWNAIRVIALSQTNTRKAIAESSRTRSTRTRNPSQVARCPLRRRVAPP